MQIFRDSDDVQDWLAPLAYEAFWLEIKPFALTLQSRQSCDDQIATGLVDQATVLYVLKGMARLELIERLHLRPRDRTPWKHRA